MPGYATRYPRQLSGGQQQRVALARAIVFSPRLLLMDEPLGALDKQLRESLQLEMRRLHADLGITFIYVTHDQEEALTMSDRIAVMHEGLIAQVGRRRICTTGRAIASSPPSSASPISCRPSVRQEDDGMVVTDCGGASLRGDGRRPAGPGEDGDPGDAARAYALRRCAARERPTQNRSSAAMVETVFAGETPSLPVQAEGGRSIVVKEPSSAHDPRHASASVRDRLGCRGRP